MEPRAAAGACQTAELTLGAPPLTVPRSGGLAISIRILISDQNFGDGARVERELVEAAGGEVVLAECRSEDDVARALAEHRPDALLVQFAPVGRRALRAADGLAAIVRYGVGVDNIDTDAADAAGVAVGRVPDYCVDEVADHTIALLLAVDRAIVTLADETRAGGWDYRRAGPVRRLRGLTLGLVGFGRIARAVAERGRALGLRLAASDPAVADEEVRAAGAEPLSLADLLPRADIVSLHVPLTPSTRGLLGERELALLPRGAVVLNTARGELVDEDALAAALAEGRLRGAGIDVLAVEPPPADHPLRRVRGVVLTPHAAWYSESAVLDLRRKAVETAFALARR
ncbi:MAG: C-terminal binding protein [Thermoleophilia bacterium]|nr:C-terminal binding protein [Thermoleophilia bacterium]